MLTESGSGESKFSLESIASVDLICADFPSYKHHKICFDLLGTAASQLICRDSKRVFDQGMPTQFASEFFLTLVRERPRLLGQDIAYHVDSNILCW